MQWRKSLHEQEHTDPETMAENGVEPKAILKYESVDMPDMMKIENQLPCLGGNPERFSIPPTSGDKTLRRTQAGRKVHLIRSGWKKSSSGEDKAATSEQSLCKWVATDEAKTEEQMTR